MNLPAEIIVIVEDKKAGSTVEGAIVALTVQAGRKNPYRICFPKTDASGAATLTREDFIGQFEDHWEAGLMDYDGSIATASPTARVMLFDVGRMKSEERLVLAWPLLKNERKRWKSRKEVFDYFATSSNAAFRASELTVDLHASSTFHFPVEKRGNQALEPTAPSGRGSS